MQTTTVTVLAHKVRQRALVQEQANPSLRYIVGIAGPPAAGKSTLARCLCDEINDRWGPVAEIAPMDGFHRTTNQLTARGDLARKGEPDTFDVGAFAATLIAVRRGDVVAWPVYDRLLHDPVPAGVVFEPSVKIAIAEGNYLLLDSPGWAQVRSCLNEAWYLDADTATIEERLIRRHLAGGKSREETMTKVASSDLPNVRLVASTRAGAQLVLREERGDYVLIRDFSGLVTP